MKLISLAALVPTVLGLAIPLDKEPGVTPSLATELFKREKYYCYQLKDSPVDVIFITHPNGGTDPKPRQMCPANGGCGKMAHAIL